MLRAAGTLFLDDSTRKLLQPSYEGSHKVLKGDEHVYILDLGGKPETDSLDWLKSNA